MIVTECGLIVQQSFVMIGQADIHRLLTSLDVPESVEESAGSVQREVSTCSVRRLSRSPTQMRHDRPGHNVPHDLSDPQTGY